MFTLLMNSGLFRVTPRLKHHSNIMDGDYL